MSSSENSNEHWMEGERAGQQFTDGQETALQQLLRLRSAIEGQGLRLAMALNQITGALDSDGNVSREMMNRVKAQILLAHLQLDELEQALASLD